MSLIPRTIQFAYKEQQSDKKQLNRLLSGNYLPYFYLHHIIQACPIFCAALLLPLIIANASVNKPKPGNNTIESSSQVYYCMYEA